MPIFCNCAGINRHAPSLAGRPSRVVALSVYPIVTASGKLRSDVHRVTIIAYEAVANERPAAASCSGQVCRVRFGCIRTRNLRYKGGHCCRNTLCNVPSCSSEIFSSLQTDICHGNCCSWRDLSIGTSGFLARPHVATSSSVNGFFGREITVRSFLMITFLMSTNLS